MKLIDSLRSVEKDGESDVEKATATELVAAITGTDDEALDPGDLDTETKERLVRACASDHGETASRLLSEWNDDSDSGDADTQDTDTEVAATEEADDDRDADPGTDPRNDVDTASPSGQLPPWPVLLGAALVAMIVVGGFVYLFTSGGAGEKPKVKGNTAASEFLPSNAAGSGVVNGEGDVFVVEDNPLRWTRAYRASGDEERSPAVSAAVDGSLLAYVLEDGTVRTYEIGADTRTSTAAWKPQGDKSPASAVEVFGKEVIFVTEDGAVHVRDFEPGGATDEVIWDGDVAAAEQIAATSAGVVVLHEGTLSFAPYDAGEPVEMAVTDIVRVEAHEDWIAALDSSGYVTLLDATSPEDDDGVVVWDGTGADATVIDIALADNLALLFDDGMVRTKSPLDTDPAASGRPAWMQMDEWGPASAVGAKGSLVMFQVEGGRARWFEPLVGEGDSGAGVYFRRSDEQAAVSFAR